MDKNIYEIITSYAPCNGYEHAVQNAKQHVSNVGFPKLCGISRNVQQYSFDDGYDGQQRFTVHRPVHAAVTDTQSGQCA